MGSESDRYVMEDSVRTLEDLGIRYELTVSSAHRNPEQTRIYAREASRRGFQVIIAGAGGAAHLAGVLATETTLPVIAVPMDTSPLHGLDSFLSTFQMPSGVPVATMGIGRSGAKNAAILAAEILALNDSELEKRLREFKRKMAEGRRMAGESIRPEIPAGQSPRKP
ncbi:MAG: 5-(carboxyamino)imidazole ribonucleotide mutase [Proteobacteria bacterium]|nr:5-(carboxyamino)imidazole ribonucleotide mutase [Pseudomonadota bacterium]